MPSMPTTYLRNDMTGRVIIKTPDTDVLVLAIHYYPQMNRVKEFWIETGTVTRTTDLRRFIPVHDICHSQSPLFLKVLPAIHALTGCDSTSVFFGIGKSSVYKTISEKGVDSFAELVFLGGDDENTSIVGACKFIASLYDPKGKEKEAQSNMNVLRAKLPPCEESLKQHVRRAAWQTRIWISSHIAKPDLGSPLEYGWKREGEKLVPVYYEGLSASEVMQDLLCTCSKRNLCSTDSCSCRKNRLACVELCSCHGDDVCQNPISTQDTSDSDTE